MDDTGSTDRAAWIAGGRLAIGLVQGLALYFLYLAVDRGTWPSGEPLVFAPLLFLFFYIPLLKLVSLGSMRLSTLTAWMLVASLVVMGLAYYDIWHGDPGNLQWTQRAGEWAYHPRVVPEFATFVFTGVAAFIAQALVASGDADRRIVAFYTTHFDVAWKLVVQVTLAALFVGIFWLVLWLGAELFNLIGITLFEHLIEHEWFAIPATALAVSASVHITDMRASLVRGARMLLLVLLSWLLPLMALIAAGFLVSLFFTGLDPLWKTRFAAGYLLIAAGMLVLLINAAYQDGAEERRPPLVMRYAASIASVALVPLVILAAYAIILRVQQYGWTTDRIGATACTIVAASYAIGYSAGGFWPGQWLAPLARWNFVTSLVILIVIGALFSPVADPIRISVESQVARLEAGKIDPNKFDFYYLRWRGGRFGVTALKQLAALNSGAHGSTISRLAKAALDQKSQYEPQPARPLDLVANITVYPRGRSLPKSFIAKNWHKMGISLPPCMQSAGYKCDAYIFDFAGDRREEIAVIGESPFGGGYPYSNGLFEEETPEGNWQLVGRPDAAWSCPAQMRALQSGQAELVPPAPPPWREVSAAGKRLTILPLNAESERCPK